eukprot:TRINITY_DN7258_c2_g1_i1.p1 TRINITY_DN7258_c2_g1~~TRINITY_DN7258_c2_g1_i1.p1  ORF type:complete len:380 (-),score=76.40 TRINITY_DN7258_c2_g1_i1:76-1152(-)
MGAAMSSKQAEVSTVDREEAVLNVFFCGTDGWIINGTTQISLFYQLAEGCDITEPNVKIKDFPEAHEFKMGFSGCGNTNGMMGTVFAAGLDEQCDQVVGRVKELMYAQRKVILNCLGLSRGGMAVLKLVLLLSSYRPQFLQMNILLFDPVPGNLITTAQMDIFYLTLANQCLDVSSSQNLMKVRAIYPHQPLPDLAFHGPILPKYPSHTEVEEIVTLGCHQGALFSPSLNNESALSFFMIKEFLEQNKTTFNTHISQYDYITPQYALSLMEQGLVDSPATVRATHSSSGVVIVSHPEGKYLNQYHEEFRRKWSLDGELEEIDLQGEEEERERMAGEKVYKLVIEAPSPQSFSSSLSLT